MLSIPEAKIYDLDTIPVTTQKWYELENMKIYYNFLKKIKANLITNRLRLKINIKKYKSIEKFI